MEPATQTTPVIYGGFRKRVLAALVDMGFGIFVVPTIVSIYYYFAEGQTLGYKVVGLKIFRSDEVSKPGFWRLLARWTVKGSGLFVLIYLLYFSFKLSLGFLETKTPELFFSDPLYYALRSGGPFSIYRDVAIFFNKITRIVMLFALLGMGIMPLSIIWNSKKRGRHDQIVDTTVLQVSNTQTAWAVVGIVLFVGGIIVNVLVRLGAQY